MKKLFWILVFMFPIVAFAQWTVLPSGTTNDLKSVFFTDSITGFVVGKGGIILKTNNGGTTWTTVPTGIISDLNAVYFTNANTGYAAGSAGTILKTIDGGATWPVLQSITNQTLYSVFFTNTDTGYVVGSGMDYNIFKTINAGSTWNYLLTNNDSTFPTINTYSLESVYFTDDITGYTVGNWWTSMFGWSVIIAKTTDGGINWEFMYSTGIPLNSIRFIDVSTGIVVGESGTILKTNDGGTTWTTLSSGTSRYLLSVYFVDKDTGYTIGDSGTILKTINAGTTWVAQLSGTTNILRAVYFTNSETGYAVGDHGTILKTTNGGINPYGVSDLSSKNSILNLYPNPSTDRVTIETLVMPARGQLSIMSLSGEELIRSKIIGPRTTIDIGNLKSGVYLVRLTNDKTVKVSMFIKQ